MKIGCRMTKQKKIILDVLKSTKSHPTADWVYEQARKLLPDISLGTVYRNLSILKDIGEIMELNYGSSYSRYDGNPKNHYHFVCTECGKVLDIDIPVDKNIEKLVQEKIDVEISYHRLEIYGKCSECKKSNISKVN